MEREFGERSFRPEAFEFVTIFSGKYNAEYRNLFARKLPGQILLSAYYTPMTTRELAVELGVASVYLEDELALLSKYHLLKTLPTGKIQTNLIIFTEDYTKELQRETVKFLVPALKDVFHGLKNKLSEVRNVCAYSKKLSESKLLWGLFYLLMYQAYRVFEKKYPELTGGQELYTGATGTNYGIAGEEPEELFRCNSFAGYARVDEDFYVTGADFGVLGKKNVFFDMVDREAFVQMLHESVSGMRSPDALIIRQEEEERLFSLLETEIKELEALYEKLFRCACDLMQAHAPKSMADQVECIAFRTIFFRTIGLFGGCAVKCGELYLPDFDGPAAICVRENTKETEATVNSNVEIK